MIGFPSKKEDKNIQIGIDIGKNFIKSASMSHSGIKPKLVNFSIKPVGDNVAKAIKDAHADLNTPKTRVTSSISGPSVIVRYIEMPSMNEEELKSAIQFEAEKVIPFNIKDIILDFAKMEDLEGNRMRVLIAAAKKDLVDIQVKMINEAGLEPAIFDIDSFAILNAFDITGIDKDKVCGLLNIGAKRSNLNIVKGGISYLSRDIEVGGNAVAKIIAESLSISAEEAQKSMEEKLSKINELSEEDKQLIVGSLTDAFSSLSDEVRLSFDYYENQYASSVDKIYLSGGMSESETIKNLLKENLGRETSKLDLLSGIDIAEGLDKGALEKSISQLAVAVGLALRRAD
ncbi:type IV pilus assembly protein PilM [Candidatus Omnitrophota bacterium]